MSTNIQTEQDRGVIEHVLTRSQIQMIEEALEHIGDFGEVRLVVEKGRLRFVVTQKSVDALKWQPASGNGMKD